MAFEIREGKETRITLSGKLDAQSAPELMDALSALRGKDVECITFDCRELTYISSAGLRTIIFAKQKIGNDVRIRMESAIDEVKDVINMVGLADYIEFA